MILREIRRTCQRNPLLTAVAIFILAIGFAGSTLAYTILRAMTATTPRGLQSLNFATLVEEATGGGSGELSWSSFEHLRDSHALPGVVLAAYSEPIRVRLQSANLSDPAMAQEISLAAVSSEFFPSFTQGTVDSGSFPASWDSGAATPQIVLSARLAVKLFGLPSGLDSGSAAGALGQSVSLGGHSFQVIAIAPPSFSGLWARTDAWVAPDKMLALTYEARQQAGSGQSGRAAQIYWKLMPVLYVLAGQHPNGRGSETQLHAALQKLVEAPENRQFHLHVSDGLTKDPVQDAKLHRWAQLTMLIACILIFAAALNYMGLLLAQAPRQAEEVRLKRVLGASVPRLMLEAMSGPSFTVLAAFILALVGTGFVLVYLGKTAEYLPAGSLNWQTILPVAALELGLVCTLVLCVALVPALRLLHDQGVPRMGHTTTGAVWANFAIHGIVSLQIASCMVMCLLAWSIFSAVLAISRQSLGYDPNHVTTLEIGPVTRNASVSFSSGGDEDFPFAAFTRATLSEAQSSLPEVQSISAASCAPFGQSMKILRVQPLGNASASAKFVHFCGVSQNYFRTMGDAIYRGHGFSRDQFTQRVSEVIINRQLARELWPGQSPDSYPVGGTMKVDDPNFDLHFSGEIVGIADDMRPEGVTETPVATVFLPLRENVFALSFPLYFQVKGEAAPQVLSRYIQQQASIYMPAVGVIEAYRIDDRLRASFLEQRARLYLPIAAAFVIACIAYLGLYGVLLHAANTRRKEMAIRACFGASKWDMRAIVLRQALKSAVIAVVATIGTWKLVLHSSADWLGNPQWSWSAIVAIPAACVIAAILTAVIPANAAAGIAPAEILKEY